MLYVVLTLCVLLPVVLYVTLARRADKRRGGRASVVITTIESPNSFHHTYGEGDRICSRACEERGSCFPEKRGFIGKRHRDGN